MGAGGRADAVPPVDLEYLGRRRQPEQCLRRCAGSRPLPVRRRPEPVRPGAAGGRRVQLQLLRQLRAAGPHLGLCICQRCASAAAADAFPKQAQSGCTRLTRAAVRSPGGCARLVPVSEAHPHVSVTSAVVQPGVPTTVAQNNASGHSQPGADIGFPGSVACPAPALPIADALPDHASYLPDQHDLSHSESKRLGLSASSKPMWTCTGNNNQYWIPIDWRTSATGPASTRMVNA
jgi:hypothetical protein